MRRHCDEGARRERRGQKRPRSAGSPSGPLGALEVQPCRRFIECSSKIGRSPWRRRRLFHRPDELRAGFTPMTRERTKPRIRSRRRLSGGCRSSAGPSRVAGTRRPNSGPRDRLFSAQKSSPPGRDRATFELPLQSQVQQRQGRLWCMPPPSSSAGEREKTHVVQKTSHHRNRFHGARRGRRRRS